MLFLYSDTLIYLFYIIFLNDESKNLVGNLRDWEDITNECNFGYYDAMNPLGTSVYKNIQLKITCFRIALDTSINNQSIIATIADFPMNSSPIMIVGSCSHETSGISVDIRMNTDTGDIISSHSSNTQIVNPRYSGIIKF